MRNISMARNLLDEITVKDNRVNWKSITIRRRNGEAVVEDLIDLARIYDRLPYMGVLQNEYHIYYHRNPEPNAVFAFIDGSRVRLYFHRVGFDEICYPSFAY